MAALVQAVVQEGWREILARVFARDVPENFAEFTRYKIGEAGFINIPPKEPDTPDPVLRDLLSEGAALASGGTAVFTNGNTGVVGVGTTFSADVASGDWIKPGPTFGVTIGAEGLTPNSSGDVGSEIDEWGQVQTVVNDLNITLTAPYIGPTVAAGQRAVHKAVDAFFTFRKALSPSDVLFSSANPAITEITAIVLAGEANLDQLGNNPEFFELGIFDSENVMVLYMTFPLETKTGAIQLNHIAELVF